jgi:hypothetical protein
MEADARPQLLSLGMTRVSSDYQNHFYTKLGKCLLLTETMDNLGGRSTTTAYLIDANERRIYAIHTWTSQPDKKYWEVSPTICELTPTMTEKKTCTSRDEFDAFVAPYLEQWSVTRRHPLNEFFATAYGKAIGCSFCHLRR